MHSQLLGWRGRSLKYGRVYRDLGKRIDDVSQQIRRYSCLFAKRFLSAHVNGSTRKITTSEISTSYIRQARVQTNTSWFFEDRRTYLFVYILFIPTCSTDLLPADIYQKSVPLLHYGHPPLCQSILFLRATSVPLQSINACITDEPDKLPRILGKHSVLPIVLAYVIHRRAPL